MQIPTFIPLALLVVGAYYIVLMVASRLKAIARLQAATTPGATPVMPAVTSPLMGRAWEPEPPVFEIEEEDDPDQWGAVEWLDDEDTILVKAAEKAVEEIKTALQYVTAFPPNPEEVCARIRPIVQSYRIFQGTEYYDPINRFIALTALKDCGCGLSDDQLQALWNDRVGTA